MKFSQRLLDYYLQEVNIIYAFWALFWLLNGLDKFVVGVGGGGELCEFSDGRSTPCGWFGTDRGAQMEAYFGKLLLPEWLAHGTLYFFACVELALGLMFAWILLRSMLSSARVSHFAHRVAFKGSMLTFLAFSVGDILFGDRRELWEHGTFLVLVLITFWVYVERNELRSATARDVGRSLTQQSPAIRGPRDSVLYRKEMVDDEGKS